MNWLRKAPVPTRRTIWLLALGVVVAFGWAWKGALILDLGLLLLCILDYTLTLGANQIQAGRNCKNRLSQGISQEIEIILSNMGNLAKKVLVRDQPPMGWDTAPMFKKVIPARSESRIYYRVTPPERGSHTFGGLWLRVEGPLGLMLRPICLEAHEEIKVYPRLRSSGNADLATHRRMARLSGFRQTKWREDGRDFDALREYVEGDDPRKIHWKATARLDRPIVQEFQPEKNQIVMILLDTGRLMGAVSAGKTKLDHALEALGTLVHAVLSGGDQAGILAFSDRVISFVPPKRTPEQLQAILEATLHLRPLPVETRYEQAILRLRSKVRRRSLVVIFTDLMDEVSSEELMVAVTLLSPRHLPLCVAIRDSEWDDLMSGPPTGTQQVYERVALHETLRQRAKGLRSLVQKGALAMDLPPSRLSVATLERYMYVKKRGLL